MVHVAMLKNVFASTRLKASMAASKYNIVRHSMMVCCKDLPSVIVYMSE